MSTEDLPYDPADELALDLLEDFDADLNDEGRERLEEAREMLWTTIAFLTDKVPPWEECTPQVLENMWKLCKSALMYRNAVRSIVMESTGDGLPSESEIEEFGHQMRGTVH